MMLYYYVWLFAQIVLESFPISSSGHLLIFEKLFSFANQTEIAASQSSFFDAIDILEHFAHGATILVIAFFFRDRWLFLLCNIKRCWRIILKIIGLVIIADLCTSLLYVLFHYVAVKSFFPVHIGFAITALLLISLRWIPQRAPQLFNWQHAIILGFVQGLALLPGISRFASTFVCARWLGMSSRKSFEISWLILVPLISAAFLNSVRLIIQNHMWHFLSLPIIITMFVAAVISYYCLVCVARLAYAGKLWMFGIYLIFMLISLILLM